MTTPGTATVDWRTSETSLSRRRCWCRRGRRSAWSRTDWRTSCGQTSTLRTSPVNPQWKLINLWWVIPFLTCYCDKYAEGGKRGKALKRIFYNEDISRWLVDQDTTPRYAVRSRATQSRQSSGSSTAASYRTTPPPSMPTTRTRLTSLTTWLSLKERECQNRNYSFTIITTLLELQLCLRTFQVEICLSSIQHFHCNCILCLFWSVLYLPFSPWKKKRTKTTSKTL